MAKTFKLAAQERKGTGKGAARAVRREGKIPAVIYGGNTEPVSVALEERDLVKEYHAGAFFTQVCELKVGNDTHKVLGRDIQLHPVSDRPLHVDFLRVTDKTRINVSVPVTFINENDCLGIRAGGTLSVVRFDVEVICRAIAIPDELTIDLSDFDIGDAISSTSIQLEEGVEFAIQGRDFAIATIAAPKTSDGDEEEGEDVEGEEGAEGEAAESDDASTGGDSE